MLVYQHIILFTNIIHKSYNVIMNIPTLLDLSQYYIDGEPKENGDARLRAYADNYYSELNENKGRINASICILKGRINEKLQQRRTAAYESIIGMTNSPEYEEAMTYDTELMYFRSAVKIYQIERGGKDTTILQNIEYMDDFVSIYFQLVFYLRRIQLKMSKPVLMEMMTYVRSKKISVIAVVQVLWDSHIGNKEIVAADLAELYREQGLYKEALFVVSMALENGREEFKEILLERKNSIMEEF